MLPSSILPNRLFGRGGAVMRHVVSRVLDVALPPLCPSCREPLASRGLCAACWSRLSFIAPPYCERLGIPFVYDPGPGVLSMEAIAQPPAYGRARAAVRFEEVSRALVHALKYGDRMDLVPLIAGWMRVAGRDLLGDADALVPVPLHWRRLWARRFNQAAALASRIAADSGIAFAPDALRRARGTAQQVGLTRSARAENVQGAFRVPGAARATVRDKHLVLVDDVLTSGATAEACARTLLRAGARQVDVLVFARVVESYRGPI